MPSSASGVGARAGAVAVGAVAGALLRFAHASVSPWSGDAFPWATFEINIIGSVALAAFLAALVERTAHPLWRPFFAVGVCGAYTTFSTFALETVKLASAGHAGLAALYVGASVVAGLAAAETARRLSAGLAFRTPPPFRRVWQMLLTGVLIFIGFAESTADRIHFVETCAAVAGGGALGALARYGLGWLVASRAGTSFPWGTLAINVTGCFLIGLYDAAAKRGGWPDLARSGAVTGFLGGYTTFSTFSWETLALVHSGGRARAAANVVASAALGVAAAAVGESLAGG